MTGAGDEATLAFERQVHAGAGWLANAGTILHREIVGLTLLGACFVGLPLVLARTAMKPLRADLGRWRYWLMALLLLAMVSLPTSLRPRNGMVRDLPSTMSPSA